MRVPYRGSVWQDGNLFRTDESLRTVILFVSFEGQMFALVIRDERPVLSWAAAICTDLALNWSRRSVGAEKVQSDGGIARSQEDALPQTCVKESASEVNSLLTSASHEGWVSVDGRKPCLLIPMPPPSACACSHNPMSRVQCFCGTLAIFFMPEINNHHLWRKGEFFHLKMPRLSLSTTRR